MGSALPGSGNPVFSFKYPCVMPDMQCGWGRPGHKTKRYYPPEISPERVGDIAQEDCAKGEQETGLGVLAHMEAFWTGWI